jgi:hypothetical protein
MDEVKQRVIDEVKQRVIDELNELSERTSKLVKFTLSEECSSLSQNMQYLMQDQIRVMLEYGNILRRRLECWDMKDEVLINDSKCHCIR